MWGGFKSYLGFADDTIPRSTPDDGEQEWVFVDMHGNEVETHNKETEADEQSKLCNEPYLAPLPLLDISNASSPQSSPQLSPTKIEEGWFVAPPPCFTKKNLGTPKASPLEDLLIEHPSMSVYCRVPGYLPKILDAPLAANQEPKADESGTKRTKDTCQEKPLLIASGKTKVPSVKSYIDLKSLIEQAENTKPSQQAKWESDQYKLCPSYMMRQNRVHRYQSRKHQNQKKKSLRKPFAEKGKHGF